MWAKAGKGEMVGKYIRVPVSFSPWSGSCAPKEAEGGSLVRNSPSGAQEGLVSIRAKMRAQDSSFPWEQREAG